MKTQAAVVYEAGKPIEIEELELAAPRDHEVLIRYTHSGLCHSDLHVADGTLPSRLPMVLGHEGAGVIEEVGPGVTRVKPGDHVICSFLPICGACRYCGTGRQSICDWGATILDGCMPDGWFPISGSRGSYGQLDLLGTFSQYGVIHEYSCIKIDDDLSLAAAALVGCGVTTGWGSAVNTGDVQVGDTVVVIGVGGLGINAVQGAKAAGAKYVIAIDIVENKRTWALEFGATHAFNSVADAMKTVIELTRGQLADSAVLTPGLLTTELITDGVNIVGKSGKVVLTGLHHDDEVNIQVPSAGLTLYRKQLRGSLFGDCNPTVDIPKIMGLYRSGDFKLDELITKTYTLEQVNQGYEDMLNGENLRGLIVHTH